MSAALRMDAPSSRRRGALALLTSLRAASVSRIRDGARRAERRGALALRKRRGLALLRRDAARRDPLRDLLEEAKAAPPPERDVPAPRLSLAEFVRQGWDAVESDALAWGPHLDMVCGALERVTFGEIKRLAINIPPGYSKSLLANVFWPAWEWSLGLTSSYLHATLSRDLATRDSLKIRQLLRSDWFRERWDVPIRDDADTINSFVLARGGNRRALSKGTATTGFRGSRLVVDDLTSATEVYSPAKLRRAKRWFWTEFMSRRNAPSDPVVVIGQRLHQEDVFADMRARGGWTFLVLPSEYDPDLQRDPKLAHTYDVPDWRTTRGALLHPERYDAEALRTAEQDMGRLDYSAQHKQRPSLLDGGVVNRDDFRTYTVAPARAALDEVCIVVDAAFEGEDGSDRVSLEVWGKAGLRAYLLDEVCANLTFTETLSAIRALVADWPGATILVERKANGSAIINVLKAELGRIVSFTPRDSKMARLVSCTPVIEAGQVWIPDARWWPWIVDTLDEWCGFPRAQYDDRVDTLTMVLIRWFGKSSTKETRSGVGPRIK